MDRLHVTLAESCFGGLQGIIYDVMMPLNQANSYGVFLGQIEMLWKPSVGL